jgi:putative sterol carrier protein
LIEMIKMFSDEWFKRLMENINTNEKYSRYASDWEGDIIIEVKGDNNSSYVRAGLTKIILLKLYHGKCLDIQTLSGLPQLKNAYLLKADATTWERVLTGKADIITAILSGKVSVTGETVKLFRYVNAARELVRSAQSINLLERD